MPAQGTQSEDRQQNKAHPRVVAEDAGGVIPAIPVAVEHFIPATTVVGDTPGRRRIGYVQQAHQDSDNASQGRWNRRWLIWPRAWSAPYTLP